MFDVPDNYDIWQAHEDQQQRQLERLPVCCHCDEPIQQETAVCIEGAWYCDNCLKNYYRKDTEIEGT